jgi:integrase
LGNFVNRIELNIIFELFKRLKVQKMATVQFRLRSKANKNVSIKVRVSLGRGNDIELNSGFTINPKHWSKETDLPKQNTTENKLIFNDLKKLESFIFINLNKDLGKGIFIDKYWLENKINECFNRTEKTDAGLILNHIQYIIDNANTRKVKGKKELGLSESRVKSYVAFKNLFTIYQTEIKKEVNFLDINKTFVDKFINWLINSEKYSMSYAGKVIDNLKTVGLDAEKLDIPTNPFIEKIESFTESNEDRYIQTLSFSELEKIRTAVIEPEHLQNARKWLLIGCEIGQRYSDLIKITKDNIRYNVGNMLIDIIQQKTNKLVTIGIKAPHIIDLLENDLPHEISLQKLNDYIKKVCKIAEVNEIVEGKRLNKTTRRKELNFYPKHELICSHSFRRSFATNYYKKMPTPILMGITGHSKESLFLTYINKREDKDANAELFIKFWEDLNKDKKPEMKLIKNDTKTA